MGRGKRAATNHGGYMPHPAPSVFSPAIFQAAARKLGVLPRRLSYAQGLGLVHDLDDKEITYLEKYWPLLDQLERVLGDDPNVHFAAILSITHTDECEIAVQLNGDPEELTQLELKLSEACVDWNVTAWPLTSHQDPISLTQLLDQSRVLADRGNFWAELTANEKGIRKEAESEEAKTAASALETLKELAS